MVFNYVSTFNMSEAIKKILTTDNSKYLNLLFDKNAIEIINTFKSQCLNFKIMQYSKKKSQYKFGIFITEH